MHYCVWNTKWVEDKRCVKVNVCKVPSCQSLKQYNSRLTHSKIKQNNA